MPAAAETRSAADAAVGVGVSASPSFLADRNPTYLHTLLRRGRQHKVNLH
jgi:hypothetical protein